MNRFDRFVILFLFTGAVWLVQCGSMASAQYGSRYRRSSPSSQLIDNDSGPMVREFVPRQTTFRQPSFRQPSFREPSFREPSFRYQQPAPAPAPTAPATNNVPRTFYPYRYRANPASSLYNASS